MVFDKGWFGQHQKVLLFFVNTWIGKWFFRIHNDVPKGKKITGILPNCLTWDNKDGTVSTDFRTHDKFAKRLYYGLKPLWHLLHFLDYLFMDRWIPQYSFGFDTLTVYPSAGAVEPVDGSVYRNIASGETFFNLQINAGTYGSPSDSSAPAYGIYSHTDADKFVKLARAITLFDTSILPDNCNIFDVDYSIYVINKSNGLGLTASQSALHVTLSDPASNANIVAADYQQVGYVSTYDSISYSSISELARNTIPLGANGKNAVNKTGISLYGIVAGAEVEADADWASNTNSIVNMYFADRSGTSQDPRLIVTYSNSHRINFFFFLD